MQWLATQFRSEKYKPKISKGHFFITVKLIYCNINSDSYLKYQRKYDLYFSKIINKQSVLSLACFFQVHYSRQLRLFWWHLEDHARKKDDVWKKVYLRTLKNPGIYPSRLNPGRSEKINFNLYFHTSLRCLKRFYRLRLKKCENKNLS